MRPVNDASSLSLCGATPGCAWLVVRFGSGDGYTRALDSPAQQDEAGGALTALVTDATVADGRELFATADERHQIALLEARHPRHLGAEAWWGVEGYGGV